MSLRIRLFGEFRLTGDDERNFVTKSANSKALLAWLAARADYRVARRLAAETLFDPDESDASSNLSVLLNRTRTSLSKLDASTVLESDADYLWLREDHVRVDYQELRFWTEKLAQRPNDIPASFELAGRLQAIDGPPLRDLDQALFVPIRKELSQCALDAMVALSASSIGSQLRSVILEKLEVLGYLPIPDILTVERVLVIISRLKLRDLLLQTYLKFEDVLAEEYGEAPSESLVTSFEVLLAESERSGKSDRPLNAPPRPEHVFGIGPQIERVAREIAEHPDSGHSHAIVGQSGIGKSVFLRELTWRSNEFGTALYVDVDQIPENRLVAYLREQIFDVLVLDHVQPGHGELLSQVRLALPRVPLVAASPSRVLDTARSTTILGSLEIGTGAFPGPAMQLILSARRAMGEPSEPNTADLALVREIAELCDGIPLALEFASRLSMTVGLAQTRKTLGRDLGALGAGRSPSDARQSSLSNAILSSLAHLDGDAQKLILLMAELGQACHLDLLMSAGGFSFSTCEEALLSGLLTRKTGSSMVEVSNSTRIVVRSKVASDQEATAIEDFDLRAVLWFNEGARQSPVDLTLAPCVGLGAAIALRLLHAGETGPGLELLGALRPWLGSGQIPEHVLSDLVGVFLSLEEDQPEAALSLGAALFHNGQYRDMRELLTSVAAHRTLETDLDCQCRIQLALAQRCLGEIDSAIEGYASVCAAGPAHAQAPTLVKAYFNLGTTLEAVGRFEEALVALDQAQSHFSNQTDPRSESLILLGIARLRFQLGEDPKEVAMVFEALLAHTVHRGDRRIFAEVLQNAGAVYLRMGDYAASALAELMGTMELLSFGYSPEFRRLSKSSFVTLATAFLALGESELAQGIRVLIDRLGNSAMYAPNLPLFSELESQTYATPPNFNLALAQEGEIRSHLLRCWAALAPHTQTAPTPSVRRLLSLPLPAGLTPVSSQLELKSQA